MTTKAKEPEPVKEADKAPERAAPQPQPSGGKTWQQERFERSYPNAARSDRS